MSLPALVSLPPAKLKNQIDPAEWTQLLSAWNALVRAYLSLTEEDFSKAVLKSDTKVEAFLESFLDHAASHKDYFSDNEFEKSLKQACLLLIARLSSLDKKPSRLQVTVLFQNLCVVYLDSAELRTIASRLWRDARKHSSPKILEWKGEWIKTLNTSSEVSSSNFTPKLTKLVACVKVVSNCGSFLMEGSDFLDAIVSAWTKAMPDVARKLVIVSFYCLSSLLEDEPKNASLLLDHAYSLKANYDERLREKLSSSILEQILGTTPMLDKFEQEFSNVQGRGHTLLQDFQTIASRSGLQRRRVPRKASSKGKGKAPADDHEDLQIHKMSLVTQVQDLFPALEIPQILRLLDLYHDDPEQVVAYLLDNPPSPTDHSQKKPIQKPLPTVSEANAKLPPHAPYTSQLPTRKNIYDGEDLATLALDPSRLYTGHKPDTTPLHDSSTSAKAAILSALAAFDSDSDERDDTYDVDDVGGTVDTTVSGVGDDDTNVNEETLYAAWKSTPKVFARDTATRKSKPRAELRERTGLTDESIEGWGIMLSRDPRRQNRLANRYPAFDGQQTDLQSSSWKAGDEVVDSEGEVQGHHTDRGRGGRMRGRGAGRGQNPRTSQAGGEGSTGGAQQSTANERRRKDANRGSRANHNRRDQRAKKISRAGFPG